ncbi:hypothetical protein ACUY3K_10465 [Corynebacterium uberis]|uniref:hypothetical protein n=1 Tax=Corynebacterium TaxID=1716 RepID=UPI001D0AA86E|nr:hypothetical protein [Corynebacterium uberis]MCZ9310328.1 hypothetical protein [Corynebacterium sp. c6VSa_13]UDL73356.1 hypothetical protein LH391_09720 [Corynebacterium uberis]UDL75766.1 hypothetical protein LH393_11210 [Corynebacterium uberis]UDL77978.1 hypothetical protein LH394_11195 [Corynebacterium uberis]UDL80261.1 hypothetical protein LH392_00095 [Corynebacterium uberis]
MTTPTPPEHPENDLHDDADFYNKRPPEPHSLEELADATDPEVQLARNKASTRQALWWLGIVLLGSPIISALLAALCRMIGGPLCETGANTWLCSRTAEIWWALGSCALPTFGAIGCGVMMVIKLQRYTRWRAWMGVFWVLVPYAMLWMVSVLQFAILGSEKMG